MKNRMVTYTLITLFLLVCPGLGFAAGELTWYLAEGSTNGYQTWICILNPNDTDALLQLTYMDDSGNTVTEEEIVAGNTRWSRNINAVTEMNNKYDVSTKIESTNSIGIIAERAMYWAAGGGHCSKGATKTSTKWYLAEGSTNGYHTWVCIQNPGDTDADIQLTCMDNNSNTATKEVTVPARRRFTQKINNIPEMDNKYEVATTISSTNNVGIIVERAMYWGNSGGHCTLGATNPATLWYLAEGSTNGYETYICILNPTSQGIDVEITYMDQDGNTVLQTTDIDANTRFTQKINDVAGMDNKDQVATKIASSEGRGVIAERAMYWQGGIDGHCSLGTTNTSMTWYLAEGSTAGYTTWLCIQNPNSATAQITITYMDNTGNSIIQQETVPGYRRFTQALNTVNNLADKSGVATKIESINNTGIIAERPMYWTSGGHCSIGTKEETMLVLCYGDSLTNGYPYGGSSETYPAKLQPLLQEYYTNGTYNVENFGISGWRADEVLADIQEYNWLAQDPDFVLLMVGGNDLTQEITGGDTPSAVIARTTSEVQEIIDLVKAHTNTDGTVPKVIVSTTLPTTDALSTFLVKNYNTSLESNLTGMDLLITSNWEDFYDSDTLQAHTELMADAVHPNKEGYQIMAQNWLEAIQATYTP